MLVRRSPRVLVIRRKPGRVRGFRDFSLYNLLERVDPLAGLVESVHEMHFWMVLAGLD